MSVLVALSVTLVAPEITALLSMRAVVASLTLLIAAPAPMPTVPASVSFAMAFAVLETDEVAVRERLPVRASPGGPRVEFGPISAFVSTSASVSASEPAMPNLPLPAPAVDSVSKVFFPSEPPVVALGITALSARPLESITLLAPIVARFWILTRLIATAAPMLAELPPVALPFPFAVESASSVVPKLAAPVGAESVSGPSGMPEIACAVMIAIPAAAATVTLVPPPSPLFAAGVLLEPEPLPLLDIDVSFPSARFLSAF